MDELPADRALSARERERVRCIRLLALGWEARDVAEAVGLPRSSVYRRKAELRDEGEDALHSTSWGGRRNEVLGEAEEAELVAHFEQAARAGQMVTAGAMAAEPAERAGRPATPSTLYRILARHGRRKVVPRPRHPEADPDRQEAFRETSRSS